MVKTLAQTRPSTKKSCIFTFTIQKRLILQYLIKKGLLKLIDIKVEDDSVLFGDTKSYYTYHHRRGHATNTCKYLEFIIMDLIAQQKYEIK